LAVLKKDGGNKLSSKKEKSSKSAGKDEVAALQDKIMNKFKS